jgi:hypothetical protein
MASFKDFSEKINKRLEAEKKIADEIQRQEALLTKSSKLMDNMGSAAEALGKLMQQNVSLGQENTDEFRSSVDVMNSMLTEYKSIEQIQNGMNTLTANNKNLAKEILQAKQDENNERLLELETIKAAHDAELQRLTNLQIIQETIKDGLDAVEGAMDSLGNTFGRIPVIGGITQTLMGMITKQVMLTLTGMVGNVAAGMGFSAAMWSALAATGPIALAVLAILAPLLIIAAVIAIVVAVFAAGFALLKGWSEAVDAIGTEFGAIATTNKELQNTLMASRVETIALGGSIKDNIEITDQLSDSFGMGLQASAELSSTVFATGKALALTNEQASNLFGTFIKIGDMTAKEAEDLAESTYQLAAQNDVNPSAVMEDIAESTELFAKYGKSATKNIAQAAVEAKKLGVNLKTVDKIADSLLDYQSSIAKEMEAEVLLGRSLNLNKAREMALEGNMLGMMRQIKMAIGGEAAFNKLNRIEREALADAIGVGVEELSKMADTQEMMAEAKQPMEDLTGEEAMSALTNITNKLDSMTAVLENQVGPAANDIAEGINEWLGNFNDADGGLQTLMRTFQGIGNVLVWLIENAGIFLGMMGGIVGGMMGFLIGGPIGAAIGSIIGGGLGWLLGSGMGGAAEIDDSDQGSFDDMLEGGGPGSAQKGGITTQDGLLDVHSQEAIIPLSKLKPLLESAMTSTNKKLDELIAVMHREKDIVDNAMGTGGTLAKNIGKNVADAFDMS